MVHALEQIGRLLKADGILIDIQPRRETALGEVHQAGRVIFAEPFPDQEDSWEDIRHAQAAFSEAIGRGLLELEDHRDFDFVVYGDSTAELQEALEAASAYSTSVQDPDERLRWLAFAARVQEAAVSAGPGTQVAYREPVRMSRLRKPI